MEPFKGGKYRQDDLPVTEKVIQEIVTLPMYPQMNKEELSFMVESIKSSLSELA
jgi:dTDP-4-amino-4,6-dideoxygalactose transaminase